MGSRSLKVLAGHRGAAAGPPRTPKGADQHDALRGGEAAGTF